MEYLQSLFENSNIPLLSAFLLGLMTAISPCPLATNVTAIAFIGKEVSNSRRVFLSGLIYTLGRAFAYTAIGALFLLGAEQFQISDNLQLWGEKLLGPLLIVIGLFMLGIIKINIPGGGNFKEKMESKSYNNLWNVFLLGLVFALAFCPYSGVLYFGMLIPLTMSSAQGLLLPFVFALATGIPVIIFAWFVAYSIGKLGNIYDKVKVFEQVFRKVVAGIFIAVGIYYLLLLFS